MVIYEVNIHVNPEIYDEYSKWLRNHLQEMLTFEGFISAEVGLVKTAENNVKTLRICYTVNSETELNSYFTHHAANMRQTAVTKFGDKFTAERRVIVPDYGLVGTGSSLSTSSSDVFKE